MIWNLPPTQFLPFTDIEESRPIVLLTSRPAWTAVSAHLAHLPIQHHLEVHEATLAHWDTLLPPFGTF